MTEIHISYQIRVQCHLDDTLTSWFAPLVMANQPNGEATLTGPLRDQAELYGILFKLYNLNFTLIGVQQMPIAAADDALPLAP